MTPMPPSRPKPVSSRKRRDGFTLIELIIVIGLIGTLAALVLAAGQKIQATADNTQCLSNLRQLGIGIQGYLADHDNYLPGPTFSLQRPTYQKGKYSSTLVATMHAYWGNPSEPNAQLQFCPILLCPAYKRVTPTTDNWAEGTAYMVSNVMKTVAGKRLIGSDGNPINPWGHPGTGDVNHVPVRLVTLGAQISLSKSWAFQDADYESYGADDENQAFLAKKPVHKNHWNRLFFDWHVESVTNVSN